jgi:hypothetical protein
MRIAEIERGKEPLHQICLAEKTSDENGSSVAGFAYVQEQPSNFFQLPRLFAQRVEREQEPGETHGS